MPVSDTGSYPVIDTRYANSRVAIMDGQTIVIGGLISDEKTDVIQKVPLLGSIPLIGFLFQNTTKEDKKTNLLLFITPHVLSSHSEVAAGPAENVPAAVSLTAGSK